MQFVNAIFKLKRERAMLIQAKWMARVVHFCLCVKCNDRPIASAVTQYMFTNMHEITTDPDELAFIWFNIGIMLHHYDNLWEHIISLKQETVELTTLEILTDIKAEADDIIQNLQ